MVSIIIVGGGIAGTRVAQDLAKFSNKDLIIKLIDKKEYFEVPYATLRGIVEPDTTGKTLRKKYQDFLRVEFILGRVINISAEKIRLEDGREFPFDIAIIATGSSYRSFSIPKPPDVMVLMKDRENQFQEENQKLLDAQNILVIGGGAVGIELAGEIAYSYPEKNITLIESLPRLLNNFKARASKIAKKLLEKMGVSVVLNEFIEKDVNEKGMWISHKSNNLYPADLVYFCIGISPNTSFLKSSFPNSIDDNKRIKVNDKLQQESNKNIFVIGDCNDVNEFKLGYLADKQARFLVKNLKKLIRAGFNYNVSLSSYRPKTAISIIPIGKKNGIVQLPIGSFKLKPLVAYKNKDLFVKRQFKKIKTKPNQSLS